MKDNKDNDKSWEFITFIYWVIASVFLIVFAMGVIYFNKTYPDIQNKDFFEIIKLFFKYIFSTKEAIWVAIGSVITAIGIFASILYQRVLKAEDSIIKHKEVRKLLNWGLKQELIVNFENIFSTDIIIPLHDEYYSLLNTNNSEIKKILKFGAIVPIYNSNKKYNLILKCNINDELAIKRARYKLILDYIDFLQSNNLINKSKIIAIDNIKTRINKFEKGSEGKYSIDQLNKILSNIYPEEFEKLSNFLNLEEVKKFINTFVEEIIEQ